MIIVPVEYLFFSMLIMVRGRSRAEDVAFTASVRGHTKLLFLTTTLLLSSNVNSGDPEAKTLNKYPPTTSVRVTFTWSLFKVFLRMGFRSLQALFDFIPIMQLPLGPKKSSLVISKVDLCVAVISSWPKNAIVSLAINAH